MIQSLGESTEELAYSALSFLYTKNPGRLRVCTSTHLHCFFQLALFASSLTALRGAMQSDYFASIYPGIALLQLQGVIHEQRACSRSRILIPKLKVILVPEATLLLCLSWLHQTLPYSEFIQLQLRTLA